ncbi:hypothetical protein U3516DRAFT_853824 [Neocallimastix sp. 'constans']
MKKSNQTNNNNIDLNNFNNSNSNNPITNNNKIGHLNSKNSKIMRMQKDSNLNEKKETKKPFDLVKNLIDEINNQDPIILIHHMMECERSKDGKAYSRVNKCIDGVISFNPVVLQSSRYDHLTCGYKCCFNQNAKVEKVDKYGKWAKKNGEWCGIGYERCTFEVLGYYCCSSVNPKVVKEDSYGKWGEEDGELCGIGEMNRVITYRIRNIKTKQCVLINNSDGNLIDLGECTTSNHSLWHVTDVDEYNNKKKKITSDKNGKCLYAANAQTPGLEMCENIMNIKDHKYLCVKNSRNLKYNGLSSKTLNFEESYDKNDESFQWEIQDIDNVDDYSCCSPKITDVAYMDETGTWGIENDDCEPTTTVNTTTTTISSTVSTISKATSTIRSGHTVYLLNLVMIFNIPSGWYYLLVKVTSTLWLNLIIVCMFLILIQAHWNWVNVMSKAKLEHTDDMVSSN